MAGTAALSAGVTGSSVPESSKREGIHVGDFQN